MAETKKTKNSEASSATSSGLDAEATAAAGVPVREETTLEKASGEGGGDELQALHDEATETGVFGTKVDPRPDSYYTVEEAGQRNEEAK